MRFILIALAALTFAAPARADVFVAADPPPARQDTGGCSASQGGVEMTGRYARDGWHIRVRVAGGPSEPIKDLRSCPELTVGATGTVVLTTGRYGDAGIRVRAPGGAFGAPIKLGSAPWIATSASGWIAALTGDEAITIAPAGTIARSKLTAGGDGTFGALRIDDAGTTTVVWSEDAAIRTERSAAGGPWVQGRSFAPLEYSYGVDQLDLAVSPNGHTLLTWAVSGNVQASIDGGPAETVTTAAAAGSPRAAINDAGDALIAFGARPGRVLVTTRPAGGTWSPALPVQGMFSAIERNETGEEYEDEPRELELHAVLAPDGRAAVAWEARRRAFFGLVGVGRGVGGGWTASAALSSPLRLLYVWSTGLDATGAPRIDWDEYEDDTRSYTRPRAAVLVPDAAAPPADRTPPEVTVELPTKAPPTRTADLRVRVPVRCSEACDVTLSVAGFTDARSLPAGRTVTLTALVHRLDTHPGNRRLAVRLWAADRAGNVVQRASTLRVRVARHPLRSYKVAPNHDFATCTRGGNRRLAQLVNSIIEGLADHSLANARAIRRAWSRGIAAIERDFPDECLGDTDVREHVYDVLDTPLTLAGYPDFYLDD
ncbi:hypothetical protein [Solirubrobacter soli]|uniref:hypothetical protein n=1 Tax=Solirubrobacter soli TaxID=363832 RepID=UPI00041559CB|nr:hypothetical protein [Solirubrobacter soli]